MANKQVVGLILNFLKKIEVGNKKGAREKKLEWQTRSDQDGKNQLIE